MQITSFFFQKYSDKKNDQKYKYIIQAYNHKHEIQLCFQI